MEKNNNKPEVKNKQPKKRGKLGTFFSEAFSEMKKVDWPKFATVLKTTLIVLGVVAAFLVVMFVFDMVLAIGNDALLLKDIDPIGMITGALKR